MTHITIIPAAGRWTAIAQGQVIADSTAALEVREGASGAVIYFPRADARMDLLTRTDRETGCAHKGTASYYSVGGLANAIWTYETPKPEVGTIAGHLAFYTDRITVACSQASQETNAPRR